MRKIHVRARLPLDLHVPDVAYDADDLVGQPIGDDVPTDRIGIRE
jgi:hypothetical protein